MRSKLKLEHLNIRVQSLRSARKGRLLIEIVGSPKDRTELGRKLAEAVGGDAAVHHLVPTTIVVKDDLDTATMVEEVKEALRDRISEELSELKVTIAKPNQWGAARAFIEARMEIAKALKALEKIRIGWLNCRIRRWERLDRCYRCHGIGITAGSCKTEDRSGLLRPE